jgi:hypothetical protein
MVKNKNKTMCEWAIDIEKLVVLLVEVNVVEKVMMMARVYV